MLLKSPVLEHLPCDTSLIAGDPVKEIIAAAEKGGSELIVASTHGRTTSRRALLGTTAEQIVRKAKTSVLIVPSHGFVPKYA
jgi:nucleotide-binding universal stress UspA family protein